jgi:hypothetical protein
MEVFRLIMRLLRARSSGSGVRTPEALHIDYVHGKVSIDRGNEDSLEASICALEQLCSFASSFSFSIQRGFFLERRSVPGVQGGLPAAHS